MRFVGEDLDWIARALVGWGMPFTVRNPPELRAALAKLAVEIAALAEGEAMPTGGAGTSERLGIEPRWHATER
jgi:hypothetical protein